MPFSPGDEVRICLTKPDGRWHFNGRRALVVGEGYIPDHLFKKYGSDGNVNRHVVYRVAPYNDPNEGDYLFHEHELVRWNGLDEILGKL